MNLGLESPDEYTYTSTAEVFADRLPTLIQPELMAAYDAEAVTGRPINRAKKANSTAARRCTIRNFNLCSLCPAGLCSCLPAPSVPSVISGVDRRCAVHDLGDAGLVG